MRAHRSVFSQLLVAFCVVAVLIGAAAAGGYITASRQAVAVRQLTKQCEQVDAITARLEADFISATFEVHNYALTGDGRFLLPVQNQEADFFNNQGTLRQTAPQSMQLLIAEQIREGDSWFDLEPDIVSASPHSPGAAGLLHRSAVLASGFVASNLALQHLVHTTVVQLTDSSRHAFIIGAVWSAVALSVAVLLVLAASLSTLYTITRPLRGLTATVRRLTAGDHSARAAVAGAAEVREVAQSVNAQADEADRLRAAEAESNRLRAWSRAAGIRIRDPLTADGVISEARLVLERIFDADVVYFHLIESGVVQAPLGHEDDWMFAESYQRVLPDTALAAMQELFRRQASRVIQDVQTTEGNVLPAWLREQIREAGVVSLLVTPFGVGDQLLGFIAAHRLESGRGWDRAEVDAVESIAADLGRGLNQARLYEDENRLVRELKSLDQAKSDFFATVSHELRAPLTTIEGYVEMLGDEEAGAITPQQRKMLETIDRSSVRLRNLIEDLFTLSKLESGVVTTVMRPVGLREVIEDAVLAVQPSAAASGLVLEFPDLSEDLLIQGDAGQLDRVLINLLSNAVKFTPQGGKVALRASAEHGAAVITVSDTGIGIPERDQKDLFQRFYRASNATARRIAGTGLGLAIVQMIVANHGGTVALESVEGQGTMVTVSLPLLVRSLTGQ